MTEPHESRWHLLLSPPLDAATNMATDVALMRRARESGAWTLRLYTWATPALSLGRNQPARGQYDEQRAERDGIAIVRRPTGGRALLHHREITYSVTGPVGDAGSLRESYRRINMLLLDGLRRLGIRAELSTDRGSAPGPSLMPCFVAPVVGEIVAEGRKLVGSAQWRDGGALLQHGSILVDDDQPLVGALTLAPVPPAAPPATLRELLGRVPALDEVAEALWTGVRAREDAAATPVSTGPRFDEWVAEARHRFLDPAWTWRR